MTTKCDSKHLLASTVRGGLHTVILPLKFNVKQIKWLAKTTTKIHFDLIFDVEIKKKVKTNWGVCSMIFLQRQILFLWLHAERNGIIYSEWRNRRAA